MNLKWKLAQYFEIRWWERYLSRQEKEDYLQRKKLYWNRILSLCPFEIRKDDLILDAGCGPAGVFIALQGFNVDAIDPLLDEYEKKLPHFSRSFYPDTLFEASSLEDFIPNKKYDLIFCINVINHVEDINKAFHTLSETCKNEKYLALSIDTHKWAILKWIFRIIPADILHPHQHDLKDYQAMLIANNFELIKTERLKKGIIFDYHIIFARRQNT